MPDTHTARDALRHAVAAEFQRLDAHDWGYDHGFCADPDADEETAAFVDAAIRIVLDKAVASIEAELYDGVPVGGFMLAHSAQEAADLLRRLAAAPTTHTTSAEEASQ